MRAKVFLITLIFCSIAACAPGLGGKIVIGPIGDSEIKPIEDLASDGLTRVHVLPFSDNRAVEAIAQIDGRLIKPEGDLGIIVQDGIERSLKKSGVRLSLFDSPTVRGEIKEWRV